MLAAVYLRSSKDRADVSLAAQMRELQTLAQTKRLKIVERYDDAVQRGSTEDRPAFQRLVADIKRRERGWDHLLIYDTSRLARGRYIAQAFKHQCRKYGVEILYVRLPETDPISAVILEAVFEAFDEVHSMLSRDKAIAGMRENVRQGFRAGGRAPWGYTLKHESTGAVREGRSVMKSHLVPDDNAPLAALYLKARAAGTPRAKTMRTLKITMSPSSLIGIEWNALVYSGATVWNRHTEKASRGNGQSKRRARADWQITEGTHEALITRAQAEAILAQLETSTIGEAVSRARRATSGHLLSEILEAPDGRRWIHSGSYYRLKKPGKGRWVPAEPLERAILAKIRADLRTPAVLKALLAAARKRNSDDDVAAPVRAQIAKLVKQKDRAARLALEEEGGDTFARLIPDLTAKIDALQHEASALASEHKADRTFEELTPAGLKRALLAFDSDRELLSVARRIVLDPANLHARIEYSLSVASPRRSDSWATAEPAPYGEAVLALRRG